MAGFAVEVVGFLAEDFFTAAGAVFFAGVIAFFFGPGGLISPLAEGAVASAAGLFSTGVFGFLATVLFWF